MRSLCKEIGSLTGHMSLCGSLWYNSGAKGVCSMFSVHSGGAEVRTGLINRVVTFSHSLDT